MSGRRLAGLTVGVGMVLGLACWLTANVPATRLRRYVSEPLPDGQRYTFLYPDRLHLEKPASPAPGFQIQMTRRINPWQALTNRAAWPGLLSNEDGEAEQICLYAHPEARNRRKGWWRMQQPALLPGAYSIQGYFVDEKEQRFTFTYSWSPS